MSDYEDLIQEAKEYAKYVEDDYINQISKCGEEKFNYYHLGMTPEERKQTTYEKYIGFGEMFDLGISINRFNFLRIILKFDAYCQSQNLPLVFHSDEVMLNEFLQGNEVFSGKAFLEKKYIYTYDFKKAIEIAKSL